MLSVLPVTRPAAPLFRLAGSKYVQTKWDAKDKKKHEEGKLVKSRNEPCCIVQVRCAALCCAVFRCLAHKPQQAVLRNAAALRSIQCLLCAGV